MNDTTTTRPVPSLRTSAITPLGAATVMAIRLGRAVAALDPADRLAVLTLATTVARDLIVADAPPAA